MWSFWGCCSAKDQFNCISTRTVTWMFDESNGVDVFQLNLSLLKHTLEPQVQSSTKRSNNTHHFRPHTVPRDLLDHQDLPKPKLFTTLQQVQFQFDQGKPSVTTTFGRNLVMVPLAQRSACGPSTRTPMASRATRSTIHRTIHRTIQPTPAATD